MDFGLLPNDFGNMTYGEAVDWLSGAVKRLEAEHDKMRYSAWLNGLTFNYGYVAAKDNNQKYPTFEELFPREKTKEEQEKDLAAQCALDRAELGRILDANSKRRKEVD